MSLFTNALDAYKTTNSLANAKRVVKHLTKRPSYMDIATETDAAIIREALRLVDSVTPLAATTTCKIAEAADRSN